MRQQRPDHEHHSRHGYPERVSQRFGLGGDVQAYAECSEDDPKPGTQVIVTDPSGKVIGNGSLGLWSHQSHPRERPEAVPVHNELHAERRSRRAAVRLQDQRRAGHNLADQRQACGAQVGSGS